MIVETNANSPISPSTCDAVPDMKLCKNEDIPMTISASLAKQSLPRKRVTKNNHGNIKEYGIMITEQQQQQQNQQHHYHNRHEINRSDGGENEYTYNNQNHHIHYLTMNSNTRDYLRKTTGHLHRSENNNSTMASTNRYRSYNQSNMAMQSQRNDSTNNCRASAMTMHSNQRSHVPNRKHHNLNQINNNFILTNEKHLMNIHNTNNDQNPIDQNNGNHLPSRLYQ